MLTVHKYDLSPLRSLQRIMMPRGARALRVKEQRGRLHLWALVDTSEPLKAQYVECVGTGKEAPADKLYVDSWITADGTFVWHFFHRETSEHES